MSVAPSVSEDLLCMQQDAFRLAMRITGDAAEAEDVRRRFAEFANPFAGGAAQRMSPADLTRHTFFALRAWSRDQGADSLRHQTPLEFASEAGRQCPAAVQEIEQLALAYSRLVYGKVPPDKEILHPARRIWQTLTQAGA